MQLKFWASMALIWSASNALAVCGDDAGPCEIDSGSYHIKLPDDPRSDMPVVLFLHGWGSSGENAVSLDRMVDPILARGYALIAPNGIPRVEDGPASWNFFPGWDGRDEASFFAEVVQDAAKRFGTSSENVLLSGFSAGAFMVYYLACDLPERFPAYAPVSGGFWRPHPASCDGPVRLFHTHGWVDTTVPLEGRKLSGGRFQQGDIFYGLEIWRAANACDDEKPSGFSKTGDFMRRYWDNCAIASALEMALFPGGHTVPEGWADMALDWYEALD